MESHNWNLRRIILLALLAISVGTASAQKFILLKDGTAIKYTTLRRLEKSTKVKDDQGKWHEFESAKVECYCNQDLGNETFILPDEYFKAKGWFKFVTTSDAERELDGRIRVYKATETRPARPRPIGTMAVTESEDLYFAEKGTEYVQFENGQKKGRRFIDSLTNDAIQPLTIDPNEFRFSDKELIQIFRDYNLQYAKKLPSAEFKKTSSVQFFLNTRSDQKLEIQINDSITVAMPTKYPLTVQLPVSGPTKVCLTSPITSYCDMLSGSRCTMKFYEVKFNEKRGKFVIEASNRKEMQKFMERISSR
jgi:hypothetical protein